jgi:glycine/D-amino acid oxidase-like deaminating enzyme
MAPIVDPVQSDPKLPDRVDVVVIGGGIVGCSAAYYLAKAGQRVALVEKGHVAGEQSSRNWGWCRQQGRDRAEVPLARHSLELWAGLGDEIGTDVGFRRTGIAFVTKDPAEMALWEDWSDYARQHQVHAQVLSPAEASAMTPSSEEKWVGGLYTPSDGRAEPPKAAPAIAEAARRLGVTVHQSCAARGLETTAGRVSAVVTEKGTIRTDAALCAGGVWTSMFSRRHGVWLPQLYVKASVLRTSPVPELTEGAIATPGVCIRRRADGGLNVAYRGRGTFDLTPDAFRFARMFWATYRQRGQKLKIRFGRPFFDALMRSNSWALDTPSPFEQTRVLDPPPDEDLLREAMADLKRTYPVLADVTMVEGWGGAIESTPDALPVISAVVELPGFYLATGFSGHGFGAGPGGGHLAADLVLGRTPLVDPTPFRFARLAEGCLQGPDSQV